MLALNAGEDYGADFLPLILDEIAGKGHHFSLSTPNSGDTHHFWWNCCARVNATGSASLSTVSHGLLDTIVNNCLAITTLHTIWRRIVRTLRVPWRAGVWLSTRSSHFTLLRKCKHMDFYHWRASNLIANVTTALHNLPWNLNNLISLTCNSNDLW